MLPKYLNDRMQLSNMSFILYKKTSNIQLRRFNTYFGQKQLFYKNLKNYNVLVLPPEIKNCHNLPKFF